MMNDTKAIQKKLEHGKKFILKEYAESQHTMLYNRKKRKVK